MTTTRLYAVWRQAHGELRRRWRSWLGLAVLVGLAGGFVIASAAGSRRTSTVYDRLVARANPYDVIVVGGGCEDEDDPAACRAGSVAGSRTRLRCHRWLNRRSSPSALVPIFSEDPTGAAELPSIQPNGEPCFSGPGGVEARGSEGGRFGRDINRYHYVSGRAPDPSSPDEVTLSAVTAQRAGIEVGDRLYLVPVDACDSERDEWPAPIVVSVVGITLAPGEVQPATGQFFQSVTMSRAVFDRLATGQGTMYGVLRLAEGVTVEDFASASEQRGLDFQPALVASDVDASVNDGLRPERPR